MITAVRVIGELPTMVGVPVTKNESQARERARVRDPEARGEVWQAAVEEHGERVTAVARSRQMAALAETAMEGLAE
jgi:6,7-dimethyl-8-ribityllumazine synthase